MEINFIKEVGLATNSLANTIGVTHCMLKETGFLRGELPYIPCFELTFVDIQDYSSQFHITFGILHLIKSLI
ncbi:hypothetical protein RclHR1_16230003 [Rhizophagus clarus]|uniref:Uncharacterized protein n=1 Tax=Rhizophagus clarus TaxID=94130 RepID=A0A2Z6QH80_9GLOM|nr:hypothetical protein RclHR1_16230003 [Rhizophagus clarus]